MFCLHIYYVHTTESNILGLYAKETGNGGTQEKSVWGVYNWNDAMEHLILWPSGGII
jgi:hypothetical protein